VYPRLINPGPENAIKPVPFHIISIENYRLLHPCVGLHDGDLLNKDLL
jgi:hypothetical protein